MHTSTTNGSAEGSAECSKSVTKKYSDDILSSRAMLASLLAEILFFLTSYFCSCATETPIASANTCDRTSCSTRRCRTRLPTDRSTSSISFLRSNETLQNARVDHRRHARAGCLPLSRTGASGAGRSDARAMPFSHTIGDAVDYGAVAFDFVDRLSRMQSAQEIIEATRTTLAQFGFERFVMSTMPHDFQTAPPRILILDLPEGWPEHYLSNVYQEVDPVVRACRTMSHPIEWSQIAAPARGDRRSAEVMHRARDFGLKFGLTLPIHPLDGGICCFSMSSSAAPFVNSFTKPAIHLMGVYAFNRARDLEQWPEAVETPALTRREREVLTWAAAGKSASMIADILGISERTAVAHTISAAHKLGAPNKTAAVAQALHKRLISL